MGHHLRALVEHPNGARAEIPLMRFPSPTGGCLPRTNGPSPEWDLLARRYVTFCHAEIARARAADVKTAIENAPDAEPDDDGMTLPEYLEWLEDYWGQRAAEPGKTVETLSAFGKLGFKLIWAWT